MTAREPTTKTSTGSVNESAAVRELLRDAFTRLIEHVDDLTDGLTEEVSSYRPTPEANSIAWLLWHSARCQDMQLCDIAGVEQVWTRDGWIDRFDLGLRPTTSATGTARRRSRRCRRRPNCWPATTTPCTR